LLQVSGPDDAVLTVASGTAAAVSFDLTQPATNVTIDAPILCIGCSGTIWFNMNAIGPASPFTDTLAADTFSAATPHPYFTFASLNPGFYAFIVAVNADSVGSAIWPGAVTPTVAGSGATRNVDWAADAPLQPFVPRSDFHVLFGKSLNYIVTGDPVMPIPEPATSVMLLTACGLLAVRLRRRR
jgi:hypothetical protein